MNWLAIVPYLLCAALGAGVAWPLARAPLRGEIADLRTAHAEAARLTAQAGAARLQAAQAAGDVLTTRLAAAQARNDQLLKEKAHAIHAATLGRACFSERALRVLDGAPGITVAHAAGSVPAPAGSAAAEGGAVATDTDVGGWIMVAGQRHEACRQRLDALIDWHARQGGPEAALDR